MDPHSRASKENVGHVNEVPPQDTTHLIQRPCYQRGSPSQDPAGNRTTRRPLGLRKEMQTALVWAYFPFIRSGQNHLARHIERGKKTRRTEEEAGRQHQGMDTPRVRQVPEGSGKQRKIEETGCEIVCDALRTPAVKEYMKVKKNRYGPQTLLKCLRNNPLHDLSKLHAKKTLSSLSALSAGLVTQSG